MKNILVQIYDFTIRLNKIDMSKKMFLITAFFSVIYTSGIIATIFPFYLEDTTQRNAAFLMFLLMQLILFSIYISYAIYLQKLKESIISNHRSAIILSISITTFLAACIYIFTSPGLSNDINLYATYGRVLWIYHANPYFTPASGFPHDPLFSFTDWKNTVAVYGPIWILVCALLTPFSGTNPIQILIAFRVFASLIHFLNAYLVYSILRNQGFSIRVVLIGTLLYALNPLILFESSTGGHNDILMTMFVLLGILWAMRAEGSVAFHFRYYIPALIAFMLAVLVKVTIIPIVALFIIMLFLKTTFPVAKMGKRWPVALLYMFFAGSICVIMLLLFYGPFWIGHSFKSIMYIFSSQPESTGSFNSLLSALQFCITFHLLPATFTSVINLHFWDIIIYGGMALTLILGSTHLLRAPTVQNAIFVTLVVMAVFLLTTNWFLPWYIICPFVMAVLCLPTVGRYGSYTGRIGKGLLALTFVFSYSAFLTYYFYFAGSHNLHTHPQHVGWLIVCYLVAFILPVLAFLVFSMRRTRNASLDTKVLNEE